MAMDSDLELRTKAGGQGLCRLDVYEELAMELAKRSPDRDRVRTLMTKVGLEFSADTTICLERVFAALESNQGSLV